jgi:putative transposase
VTAPDFIKIQGGNMPEYHRSIVPGGVFFFTVVTFQRARILTLTESREFLHAAWKKVKERYPFQTDAVCLLPDHIHCIWSLPEGDANYSLRWSEIKKSFSKAYLKQFGTIESKNVSQQKRGEAAVWQRRFWEHTIRDLDDFNRHINYIHFNPVKHGLVNNPEDWQWSSYHRFLRQGYYEDGWGAIDELFNSDADFGE